MKKTYKAIKKAVMYHVDAFAPYMVYNEALNKEHYCWNWKDVIEWLSCYDSRKFGITVVCGFTGKLIASKGA